MRIREFKPMELVEILVPDYRRLKDVEFNVHRRTSVVLSASYYRNMLGRVTD